MINTEITIGTEKQIKWGKELQAKYIELLEEYNEDIEDDCFDDDEIEMIREIEEITKRNAHRAEFWINTRDYIHEYKKNMRENVMFYMNNNDAKS